jgi:hypothetical protein
MKIPDILQTYRLPGRIRADVAAELLGFAEYEIPILIKRNLLKPLGVPSVNSPKYFASADIEALRTDPDWLAKATKEVAKNWRRKNDKARASGRE